MSVCVREVPRRRDVHASLQAVPVRVGCRTEVCMRHYGKLWVPQADRIHCESAAGHGGSVALCVALHALRMRGTAAAWQGTKGPGACPKRRILSLRPALFVPHLTTTVHFLPRQSARCNARCSAKWQDQDRSPLGMEVIMLAPRASAPPGTRASRLLTCLTSLVLSYNRSIHILSPNHVCAVLCRFCS